MIVLALDSSTDAVSVAVLRDGEAVAIRARRAARPLSESLLPAVEAALDDARIALADLSLVAVATGPGSFNGIRGGIATAEGLSIALGVDAVGVPTLDALAYEQAGRAPAVLALLPAGRDEFYGATYTGTWDDWRAPGGYDVAALDGHLDDAAPDALVCGRLDDAARQVVARRGFALAPAMYGPALAVPVGILARQRMRAAEFDRAASLRPLYLRRPGITRPSRPLSPVGARPE